MAAARKSTLKRPKHRMPAYLKTALVESGLLEAYKVRPPYQQNDYIGWIVGAKLETTQQKRLKQMLSELKSGRKYMNMAWADRRR